MLLENKMSFARDVRWREMQDRYSNDSDLASRGKGGILFLGIVFVILVIALLLYYVNVYRKKKNINKYPEGDEPED